MHRVKLITLVVGGIYDLGVGVFLGKVSDGFGVLG
jgi:hypothetical protein